MASHSEEAVMQPVCQHLDALGIANETRLLSAKHGPDVASEYARTAMERGLEVLVAGAGVAPELPGVLAAHTTLPVIAVPLVSDPPAGGDALMSTTQLSPGIPVGTVDVGEAGTVNAAFYAAAILGLKYPQIRRAIEEARATLGDAFLAASDSRQA